MTDDADRTGLTYVTHGKMIYFTVLRMHCDGAAVGAALRSREGASKAVTDSDSDSYGFIEFYNTMYGFQ